MKYDLHEQEKFNENQIRILSRSTDAHTVEIERLRAENNDLWEFVEWIIDSWPSFRIGRGALKIKNKYGRV